MLLLYAALSQMQLVARTVADVIAAVRQAGASRFESGATLGSRYRGGCGAPGTRPCSSSFHESGRETGL
jgi:hypothetical protein